MCFLFLLIFPLLKSHAEIFFLSLSSVIITAGKTPGFQLAFDALDFYRHNKALLGINTIGISFKNAISELANLKLGFESGELVPPAAIEEIDLRDGEAVVAAYEKVKAGAKAKQILVNRKD